MKSSYPVKFAAIGVLILSHLFFSTVLAHSTGTVAVSEAWVREAPPNVQVMAAYMTIENHTAEPKTLTEITSSSFERIEIHRSVDKDGVSSMVKQTSLIIDAQGKAELKPGGLHLMLFNPKKPLKAGDEVGFALKFAGGGKTFVTAKVKKGGETDKDQHTEHHEHHEHAESHDHSHQH